MHRILTRHRSTAGFTMFFAVLVSSLALAIGIAIYDLVVRQLALSSTVSQSQIAIYAADTGIQCALYWDFHYNGTNSAFATSSTDAAASPSNPANCMSHNILSGMSRILTANSGSSSTTLKFTSGAEVIIEVDKTVVGGIPHTQIYAKGYNVSDPTTNPNAVEREFESYY